MRLLLVRHGESICGVNGVVGGPTGCTGLTELGLKQAEALRDRLVTEGFEPDVVMSSTLPRAMQTADALAAAWDLDVERDPDLREFDPGDADGMLWDEARERFGPFEVVEEPDRPFAPGGESLNAFRSRIARVLDRCAETHDGQTVVAACHGGPIFMSVITRFEIPRRTTARMHPDFTSITEWERADGHWILHRFNDTAHLR